LTPKRIFKWKSTNSVELYGQLDGQPVDEFVTEIRKLAKNCQFANTDNEILTQVIQNCKSNRLRRRTLSEPDKTLDDLLTMGGALEMANAQALTMERDSVNKVHTTQRSQPHKPRGYKQNIRSHNHNDKGKQQKRSCRNCGGQFPHKIECPAKGKTCNF
jgi:hypothetical protein